MSMEFFDIQATTECTFTLKCACVMVRTLRHKSLILTKNAHNFTRFYNNIGEVSQNILNNISTVKHGSPTLSKS